MSDTLGLTVRVQCHGRFQWTGYVESGVFGYERSVCSNRCRSPQEVLRELADDIDRAAVQELFVPFKND